MAKVIYELYKNENSNSKSFGKVFARTKSIETMNLRKMSAHIAEHGSVYTEDVVSGVLKKFEKCVLEMLLNSRKVKIDGLGTFYTTLENRGGGSESAKKFNIGEHIKGLHIRFLPDMEQELGLSSPEFVKKASFINAADLTSDKAITEDDDDDSDDGGDGDDDGDDGGDDGG